MRFFIALEIPEKSRQELSQIQHQLLGLIPDLRLSQIEQLHLTIAFVGEQKDNLKDDLVAVLRKAAEAMSPFEVTPAYIDGFPNIHQPHTLWAGIKGDIDKLLLIRERVKDGLIRLQLDVDERRFIPHIALAKLNTKVKISLQQEEQMQEIMAKHLSPILVSSIKLFESAPDNGFHKHNTLAEVPLEG